MIFFVDTKGFAKVDSAGEITGVKLGRTLVRGKAVDPKTGKIYSEDTVEVNVVPLSGLKIVSPLTYLYENEKMPVWIKGLAGRTEISPDNLARASPSLIHIDWRVSNTEYAEVIYVFEV